MRFGNWTLTALGGLVILASSAVTASAGVATVPEMDSASLLIVGFAVGGYLIKVSRSRRK